MRALLILIVGVLIGANAVYFLMSRGRPAAECAAVTTPASSPIPPEATSPTPTREPSPAAPAATAPPAAESPPVATSGPSGLSMPLPSLTAAQLLDTFNDTRGGTRRHEALDIHAAAGTPVLAVADGHVEKLFTSDAGGLTIYQFDTQKRYAYYYAHLQGYAAGLREGQPLRRGQTIGYVGSTGNANPAAPHLHFAVFELGPEKRWWKGTPLNPYPLLGGRAAPPVRQ